MFYQTVYFSTGLLELVEGSERLSLLRHFLHSHWHHGHILVVLSEYTWKRHSLCADVLVVCHRNLTSADTHLQHQFVSSSDAVLFQAQREQLPLSSLICSGLQRTKLGCDLAPLWAIVEFISHFGWIYAAWSTRQLPWPSGVHLPITYSYLNVTMATENVWATKQCVAQE